MRLARFIGGRLAATVIVLLVVGLATYAVFYLLPTDPAQLSCGRPCTPQNLATARAFMGFDHPWIEQYLQFIAGIFTGRTFGSGVTAIHCPAPCFGYSFQQNETVLSLIASRLPVTASLAIGASIIWLVLGVAVGVLSALKRGSPIDRITMAGAVAGVSAPAYVIGLIAILIFGLTLNIVPDNGYVPLTTSPVGWLWHLITPWLVLAFLQAATYARLTRTQMLDVLGEDFIRTARAKGLAERNVVGKHALRNVLLPVVTVFGLDLGSVLGGAILTETVFSMPGLGQLLITAVHRTDLPLLMGCTLFAAFVIVLANFLVDLLYGVLDPRARLT
ncbi:MAG TPA: ABC transporter permease [Pseudonocardiaceae bacterium]|jgi:peptide/nickel transport system permease protein|nr:ABC transporter permease [Pseudonocardiaceae bacterium]